MGCSASRLDTLLAKAIQDPSFSLSSQTSSSSSSSSSSTCNDNNKHVITPMPKPRSLVAPLVHHPAIRKGDSHHLVSLTSSTYGSLIVVDNHPSTTVDGGDFSPDSVINTWELMEGLEEDDDDDDNDFNDDLRVKSLSCDFNDAHKMPNLRLLSDSYVFVEKFGGQEMNSKTTTQYNLTAVGSRDEMNSKITSQYSPTEVESREELNINTTTQYSPIEMGSEKEVNSKTITLYSLFGVGSKEEMNSKITTQYSLIEVESKDKMNSIRLNSKPLWKHLSEESLLAKMDPNVAASYQKALSGGNLVCNESRVVNKFVGSSPVATKIKSVECNPVVSKLVEDDNAGGLDGCEDKIVLYFTSLRGIRRTYEDCCTVRLILRGCRVMVDERDISMDSSYRKELQSVLGGKAMTLPQLFVRGKRIGGADEIKQMHETGELERLLDGFPILEGGFVCDSCGDARFIPCSNCSGSRKIFLEEEGQTMRCPDCNENGLVRCPGCC